VDRVAEDAAPFGAHFARMCADAQPEPPLRRKIEGG